MEVSIPASAAQAGAPGSGRIGRLECKGIGRINRFDPATLPTYHLHRNLAQGLVRFGGDSRRMAVATPCARAGVQPAYWDRDRALASPMENELASRERLWVRACPCGAVAPLLT